MKSQITTTKQVREQIACPNCPSSDAFTVYDHSDGTQDGYCFSCAYYTKTPYGSDVEPIPEPSKATSTRGSSSTVRQTIPSANATEAYALGLKPVELEDGLTHPVLPIAHRGISRGTAEHFGVRTGVSPVDGETPLYTLFPRYRDNELVGFKTRPIKEKKFIISGGSDVQLFGQHLIKPQGKKIWITEGEFDCMAVYQVLKEGSTVVGWEPPVASIPDGSSSAAKAIAKALPILENYEEVIIVFDSDSPGRAARDEVCKILAGKVSYVELPMKDANDMLLSGRASELKWLLLTNTKKYQPDGILTGNSLWERYTEKQDELVSFPYPPSMTGLNSKLLGARLGSIVTVTSGTGMGKSQFLKELFYHYLQTTNEKVAGMFLEEDTSETIQSLISLHLHRRLGLGLHPRILEEEQAAFKELDLDNRVSLYDYFGGMDDGSLLSKLRYLAVTGHRIIFLDHLSIVVSEYAAQGGERERIDTLMTKLAKFAKEFNILLFLVVHLRKVDNSRSKSFEEGGRPTLDDLRGSGSLKQLSWDVIGLSRNQQHEDPFCANTTEVTVLKCRYTGRTGVAGYLHFNDDTGRMNEVERPVNYFTKKGSNKQDTEEF